VVNVITLSFIIIEKISLNFQYLLGLILFALFEDFASDSIGGFKEATLF